MMPKFDLSGYWSGLAINSDIKNSWFVALFRSDCLPPLINNVPNLSARSTAVVFV